jgi:hypothetical protein
MTLLDTDGLQQHVGTFGFSAKKIDELEEEGYTLVVIVYDRSGSTAGFAPNMEAMLMSVVGNLQKNRGAYNPATVMLRLVTVSSDVEEVHGFIPILDIDVNRYRGALKADGMTALFDGCIDAAESVSAYGAELQRDRFKANAVIVVITDGANNAGRYHQDSDVDNVRRAFEAGTRKEALESLTTILLAVNMKDVGYRNILERFHSDAGFSVPMKALEDADADKISQVLYASVSTTSTALGTGAPSQLVI